MKIKILLMPLMLIGIIYLSVWVAVPMYSDPGGIADAKIKLENSTDKLRDIETRANNAEKLVAELNQNSSEQKMLFHYLPDEKLNEDVVASLNSIASANGVAVTSLAFKDIKAEAVAREDLTTSAKNSLDFNKEMDSPKNIVPKKTLSKNFNASITVAGDYEKIKNFVVAVSAFKRFNDIEMIGISKQKDANFLEATIDMKFNYLEKLASLTTIDREMFKDGKFNMVVTQEIFDKTNVNITKLEVESAGRTNPFSL